MQGSTPHYDAVINHVGSALTPAVQQDPRCRELGITSGSAYLRFWIASVIRRPEQLLPAIYIYGGQASGKSAFAALPQCLLADGYRWLDLAIRSPFNSELDGAIVGVIEEADRKVPTEWATSPTLTINRLGKEPYEVPNRLHLIVTSNTPPETDDPAVVAIEVLPLTSHVPYDVLRDRLRAEASSFLVSLYRLDLPEGGLPVPQGVAVH